MVRRGTVFSPRRSATSTWIGDRGGGGPGAGIAVAASSNRDHARRRGGARVVGPICKRRSAGASPYRFRKGACSWLQARQRLIAEARHLQSELDEVILMPIVVDIDLMLPGARWLFARSSNGSVSPRPTWRQRTVVGLLGGAVYQRWSPRARSWSASLATLVVGV